MDRALRVDRATTPTQLRHAAALVEEYAQGLPFRLDFQDFAAELAAFPGPYALPAGCLLLAESAGTGAGCVALRDLGDRICEMKRLFVRPAFRGRGVGRALATRLLDEARGLGYRTMRLDTVASMAAANALYRSLGFVEIAPSCANPLPGATFLERALDS